MNIIMTYIIDVKTGMDYHITVLLIELPTSSNSMSIGSLIIENKMVFMICMMGATFIEIRLLILIQYLKVKILGILMKRVGIWVKMSVSILELNLMKFHF